MNASVRLEAVGVSKSFSSRPGAPKVLDRVSFSVEDGEFVSLVGASGSGKTTLLRIFDGLLPITEGSVLLDGEEVRGPSKKIGFVFQDAALLPWKNALDNVAFSMLSQGIAKEERRSRALEMLQLVGLGGKEDSLPKTLSGGMRQRVNLARALALDPEVLLMDEPFASLDAQTREIMQAELLRIWADRRKSAVFVTHQIEEAVYLSDKVVVLGSDPGHVRDVIRIDIPRPRDPTVRRSPEVADLAATVWSLIELDVVRSMQAGRD